MKIQPLTHSIFYAEPDESGGGLAVELDAPPGRGDSGFEKAMAAMLKPETSDAPPETKVDPPPADKPPETKPPEKTPAKTPRELFKKAEPAADPKPDEPPVSELDKIKPPDGASEATMTGWKALHSRAKAVEAELGELRPKYQELEKKAQAVADLEKEVETLRAKQSEMSALVERANVEAHPDFRKKYVDGRQELVSKVEALVKDNDGDPSDVAAALALKGGARNKALASVAENLPGFQQGILGQLMQQLDQLDAEAGEKRAKSGEYWKELQAEQAQRETSEREAFGKKSQQAFEAALRKVRADMPVLQKLEGDDKWSGTAAQIEQEARQLFETNDDLAVAAENVLLARSAKPLLAMLTSEMEASDAKDAKIAELEAELTKMHAGGPRLGGGPAGDGKSTTRGFLDILKEQTGLNH